MSNILPRLSAKARQLKKSDRTKPRRRLYAALPNRGTAGFEPSLSWAATPPAVRLALRRCFQPWSAFPRPSSVACRELGAHRRRREPADQALDVHHQAGQQGLDEHAPASPVACPPGAVPAHHLAQRALDPPMLPTDLLIRRRLGRGPGR